MRHLKKFDNDNNYKVGDIVKTITDLPYDKFKKGSLFIITRMFLGDSTYPFEVRMLDSGEHVWLGEDEFVKATDEEISANKYNL